MTASPEPTTGIAQQQYEAAVELHRRRMESLRLLTERADRAEARVQELEEALLETRNALDACAAEGCRAGVQVEAADAALLGAKP